ncbi:MAG: hypothetical protein Q8L34_00750 [Candidatus Woesearchaeota archaeon]|nr:hypothetical protein [Candidatus Woesearchaeota archaeon]
MAVMLLSAFTVSATITTVNTFASTNPTFGSDSQVASNPKHDTVAERDQFATTSIQFSNSGAAVDAVMTVQPVTPFSITDLRIENQTALSFAAGQTTVSFRSRIPEKLDAVDAEGEAMAFKVATLIFTDPANANVEVGRFDVYMQRENNLEMNNFDANIDGGRKKSLSDDDTLENLKPGDRIELEAEARNNYDNDANVDIESVSLEIECTNENNLDFDDTNVEIGDISPEDEQTDTLSIDIESDAEDKDSDCLTKIIGRDQNGARHGEGINFLLEITRESHDIQITAATINPTSLSCTDREMQLTVEMLNLGRSNEDRVALEVTSKAISFQERVSNIELDEDDSAEEIFVIPVNAETLKSGPFAIQVQTFYDNTRSSDTETVQVDNLCGTQTTGNGNGPAPGPVVQGALELDTESIQMNLGSSASIAVKVNNLENTPVEYTVTLADTAEFAEGTATKTVFLNPGQQSTVLLNLRAKEDIDTGKYSGIIVLKDNAGKTLETKTFTVDVTERQGSSFSFGNLFGGADSRIFWIIGDIILIIVAIFFIRLIFTGGKRKQQPTNKKLADYEAEMSKKKTSRRRK